MTKINEDKVNKACEYLKTIIECVAEFQKEYEGLNKIERAAVGAVVISMKLFQQKTMNKAQRSQNITRALINQDGKQIN